MKKNSQDQADSKCEIDILYQGLFRSFNLKNGLIVTVGISHSLFSYPRLFIWRRNVYLSRAGLIKIVAWLPYPSATKYFRRSLIRENYL